MKRMILAIAAIAIVAVGCQSDDLVDATNVDPSTESTESSSCKLTIAGSVDQMSRGTLVEGDEYYEYEWDATESFILSIESTYFYNGDSTSVGNYCTITAIEPVDGGANLTTDITLGSMSNTTIAAGKTILSAGPYTDNLVCDEIDHKITAKLPTDASSIYYENATTLDPSALFVYGSLVLEEQIDLWDYPSIVIEHEVLPAIIRFALPDSSNGITIEYVKLEADSDIFYTDYLIHDNFGEPEGVSSAVTSTVMLINDKPTEYPEALYGAIFPFELGINNVDIWASVNGELTQLGTITANSVSSFESGNVYRFDLEDKVLGLTESRTINIGVDEVTNTLAVFTANESWTANSDSEWLTLSTYSGDGETTKLQYTADSNLNTETTELNTRTATVTVTVGDAVYVYTIGQDAQYMTENTFSDTTWCDRGSVDTYTFNDDGSVSMGTEGVDDLARLCYGTTAYTYDKAIPFGRYEFTVTETTHIHYNDSENPGYITLYVCLDGNYETNYANISLAQGRYNARYYGDDKDVAEFYDAMDLGDDDTTEATFTFAIEVAEENNDVVVNYYLDRVLRFSYDIDDSKNYSSITNINIAALRYATAKFLSWEYYSPVTKWEATE